MNTITTNSAVDKYFAALADLKPDVKIGLIKKLEDSLKVETPTAKEGDDIIDQLAGAWNDYGKTAEEIIADIK